MYYKYLASLLARDIDTTVYIALRVGYKESKQDLNSGDAWIRGYAKGRHAGAQLALSQAVKEFRKINKQTYGLKCK